MTKSCSVSISFFALPLPFGIIYVLHLNGSRIQDFVIPITDLGVGL